MPPEEDLVLAAGGVVLRGADQGRSEVALVHRRRYDDWSLPKGKLQEGETLEQAALREVEEETGLRCRLGRRVGEVSYRDRKDRRKRVTYWLMEPLGGTFQPTDEVDAVRWVLLEEAPELMTHRLEHGILLRAVSSDRRP